MDRMLPVVAELSGLLPGRGLRRGSTVAVAGVQTFTGGRAGSGDRLSAADRAFMGDRASAADRVSAGDRASVGDRVFADPQAFVSGQPSAGGRTSAGRPSPVGGRAFAGERSAVDGGVSAEGQSAAVSGRASVDTRSPAVGGRALPDQRVGAGERGMSAGGGTSLMLALLAAASRSGSWCAVVGVPSLGALAAAESGIVLERLALVPDPGPDWPTVVAALIDGVDVVVAAVPGPVPSSIVSRLAARARQRGSVLVPLGDWSGADVTLHVGKGRWDGLGSGAGRLRRREVTVVARGRGAAARPREITMWMPGVTVRPLAIPPAPARPGDPTPRRSSRAAGDSTPPGSSGGVAGPSAGTGVPEGSASRGSGRAVERPGPVSGGHEGSALPESSRVGEGPATRATGPGNPVGAGSRDSVRVGEGSATGVTGPGNPVGAGSRDSGRVVGEGGVAARARELSRSPRGMGEGA